MSHHRFLARTTLALLPALWLVTACGGDDSAGDSSGGSGESDSGSGSGDSDSSASADESSESASASATGESSEGESSSSSAGSSSSGAAACADECAGCCDGDTCMDGDLFDACGMGGEYCTECAVEQACTSNACALDQDKVWSLIAVSATIPAEYDSGGPGSCYSYIVDPFLVATINMNLGETDVAEESAMPVWNDDVALETAAIFLGEPVLFFLSDDDGQGMCSEDDPIDNCAHQITEADLAAGGFTIDYCGTAVEDLAFELVPA